MSEYDSVIAAASKLINKKGKSITITRSISSSFDPVLGEDTITNESQTIKAVILPASGGKIQALDLRYGLTGLSFERLSYFMMAGKDIAFSPEPGQKVTVASEDWTILGVTPLNPNEGAPIMYDVAIRI